MGNELEDIYARILQLSAEEKVRLGKSAIEGLRISLSRCGYEEKEAEQLIMDLTKMFVSGDRSCSGAEYRFYRDVTDSSLTFDEFFELTNRGASRDFVETCLDKYKLLDEEGKYSAALFASVLLGADNAMTRKENALLERLINAA